MITSEKQHEIKQVATSLYSTGPDWVSFYREVLGLHGIVRRCFPGLDAMKEFEETEAYEEIQRMLTKLREKGPLESNDAEPTRVITVRLPKSLHEALRVEAHEHQTSMNKLCISKLLQMIDNEFVPAEI
jgi:predicted HicB family RNase H-like nuclease